MHFTPCSVSIDTVAAFQHKVDSFFHVNCRIVLPVHQPGSDDLPMEICVSRALREYHKCTGKYMNKKLSHTPLFHCQEKHSRHKVASKQNIALRLQETIPMAYKLIGVPAADRSQSIKAHSTRKVVTSFAFEKGVNIDTLCQAATLKNSKAFFNFYKWDVDRQEDSLFGLSFFRSAVLNVKKRSNLLVPRSLPTPSPIHSSLCLPSLQMCLS